MSVMLHDEKERRIEVILKKIFDLPKSQTRESIKEAILGIIKTTINGDSIITDLVIDVTLKNAVYIYILTNTKLIQLILDANNEIESLTLALVDITGIERKSTQDGKMDIRINFSADVVGLTYPVKNNEITAFFQEIEKSWIARGQNDR